MIFLKHCHHPLHCPCCPHHSIIVPITLIIVIPPIIIVGHGLVVVVDAGDGRLWLWLWLWLWLIEHGSSLGLFWVMWPLPSHVGTYLTILHTILAPMAEWSSLCFIATAKGQVFKSMQKQMFFCTT